MRNATVSFMTAARALTKVLAERTELTLRLVLGGAQLAALFWFARPVGFPLDDAWIHQVVGRTFAATGTLGYAPGEFGAAATSYAWAALLAFNFKVCHVDPVAWALVLNGASLLAVGQLLFTLLGRAHPADIKPRHWQMVSLLTTWLACTGANTLWFAHSGMEALLLVASSLSAVWAASNGPRLPFAVGAGAACGLLAWTRPECSPLAGLLGVYAIVRWRKLMPVVAFGAPAALAIVAYGGINVMATGHALPSTLSGRRWLWFEVASGLSGFDRAVAMAHAWIVRLSTYTFDTSGIVFFVFFGLGAWAVVRLWRTGADGVRLLFVWAAMHTALYAVLLPTPGHGGRYQPFLPLLYPACVALGAVLVLHDVLRALRIDRPLACAAMVPLFILSRRPLNTLRGLHAQAVAHIRTTELGAGALIDTLPNDGNVASFDIGGSGWAAHRPVLDAGGLSDPETAGLLERGRLWEHLRRKEVRYLVLPEGYDSTRAVVDHYAARLHLLDNPAVHVERLYELETPFEKWGAAFVATWNASPKQVVYRLEYTGAPGPREVVMPAPHARRPIRDPAGMLGPEDRVLIEHALAILDAAGAPVDLTLAPGPTVPPAQGACAIALGMWGVETTGCADAARLRSVIYEFVMPWLDANDLAGAARGTAHAVARAERLRDPTFDAPLPPLQYPGAPPPPPRLLWRLVISLAVLASARALSRSRLGSPND